MTNHILENESKPLMHLLHQVDQLQQFNKLFAQNLEPELAKRCQIAKYEKNCFIVLVDNGSWTTQLRFQIPDLLAKLRLHPGLEKLNGIICKTRPNHMLAKAPKNKTRKVSPLSAQTAATILEAAKSIQDKRLREILERIATRQEE